MRFREKRISKEDAGKYILWVDLYALYPYAYEEVMVSVSLWEGKKEIIALTPKKLTITTPLPNPQWLSVTDKKEKKQTVGIPFAFDALNELKKVTGISFSWVFKYHNEHGENNRLVLYGIESFTIIEDNEQSRDFVIEKKCTSIPSIMEKQDNQTRRALIDDYDEVLHAKAEMSVRQRKDIAIYTSRIKSENNIDDGSAYIIANRTLDQILEKDMIEERCDNVFMCIFLNQTLRVIWPISDETKAYLFGSP